MSSISWVPLHVHSQYSLLDATASVEEIPARAAEYKMAGVALTDHGSLYGAVEFYKACKATGTGLKPVIGCEFYVAPTARTEKRKIEGRTAFDLVLLAKNQIGYRNLCILSSAGFLEGFYYNPRIDFALLSQHAEGLICLSSSLYGRLAHEILHGTEDSLQEHIASYRALFGEDYYFELMRHTMSDEQLRADGMFEETWLLQQYHDWVSKQERVNTRLLELAEQHGISYVATQDSHYMNREEWRAHEILINIQSGEPCELVKSDERGGSHRIRNPKRSTYSSHALNFKSPQEMHTLFADLPRALEATQEILEKCCLEMDFTSKHYPVYVPPSLVGKSYTQEEQARAAESFLVQLCEEGIPKRYTESALSAVEACYPGEKGIEVVRKRLTLEMSVIAPKGMCDYLLIVWDFIHWAKNQGIPMGPGRGSGAGSIVLYLIGVTDIEPLRFGLFFERFINPERISYPDIDVDICMQRRGEVIAYTLEKYGKDNVAQIITFNTMKARMTVKDVGRVLNVPLTKVNAIAKLIPEELQITLEMALEREPELRLLAETDEEVKRILTIGKTLEGSIRNTGIHAAGLIISGDPLTQWIPLCTAKDSDMPVTQFSMKPVEEVGMLKIDFLGLKTLTAIQWTVDAVFKQSGKLIDWVNLPLDDAPTFDLLNQGKTSSVFQLESSGMQELAKQLHLDCFEEIIAVGALYRPGPMDMIPSFIARKKGTEQIEYDHPKLKSILSETYGIMVYQEQVMQIANDLAGFSLGEGDVLRRAMGKKELDKMIKQREKFRTGALRLGTPEDVSMAIFDKIEKFASYGFNKSHATAYGYISYVTAYLKAHYPAEWFAALMTCDRDDLAKVGKWIREAQTMQLAILPPDVNASGDSFVATPVGIRFAISGIKGIGSAVVESIVRERTAKGAFTHFYNFFQRMDVRRVGKKTVENLVEAGCFDTMGWSRDALKASIEPMFDAAVKEREERELGILTLFSRLKGGGRALFMNPPVVREPTPVQQTYIREKALLGFFLSGSPLDPYKKWLGALSCVPLEALADLPHDRLFRTAVWIDAVEVRVARNQKKFAILSFADGTDNAESLIWADLYEEKRALLEENQLLYLILRMDRREGTTKLHTVWMADLTQVDETMIQQADYAYEQASEQAHRTSGKGGKSASTSFRAKTSATSAMTPLKSPKEVSSMQCYTLALDIEQVRLTHFLQMAEWFQEHSGSSTVRLSFHAQDKEDHPLAYIHIDASVQVAWEEPLLEKLRTLPSVRLGSLKSIK